MHIPLVLTPDQRAARILPDLRTHHSRHVVVITLRDSPMSRINPFKGAQQFKGVNVWSPQLEIWKGNIRYKLMRSERTKGVAFASNSDDVPPSYFVSSSVTVHLGALDSIWNCTFKLYGLCPYSVHLTVLMGGHHDMYISITIL